MEKVLSPRVVAYLHPNGNYAISLPRGSYRINGFPTTVVNSSEEIILPSDSIPQIAKVSTIRRIKYYANSTGVKMAVADFIEKQRRLDIRVPSENRYGEVSKVWPEGSVDTEVASLVHSREWLPIHAEITVLEHEFEVVVQELPVINHKWITPLSFVGGSISSPLCQYNPSMPDLFREVAAEYGMKELPLGSHYNKTQGKSFSFHKPDTLEYMVGFGTYIYGSREGIFRPFKGTYEQCVKEHAQRKNTLRLRILHYIAKTEQGALNAASCGSIYSNLLGIQSSMGSLNVMKKSNTEYYQLRGRVNKLLENLSHAIIDQTGNLQAVDDGSTRS